MASSGLVTAGTLENSKNVFHLARPLFVTGFLYYNGGNYTKAAAHIIIFCKG